MSGLLWYRAYSTVRALVAEVARAATLACALATTVAAAVVVFSPAAHASVFKCAMADGGFIYQEDPCPPGKELRNFDIDPPTLSVIPGTPTPAAPRSSSASDRPPDKPAASASKSAKRMTSDDRSNGRVDGDAAARKFIRPGMSDAEVRARIGQPDVTSGSSKSRNARWSYLPATGDPDTITTITFSGNMVSDVSRKPMKK